jgi:hypothetical protein
MMATLEAELLFKLQITFGQPALVGNIGKGTRSIGGGPGRVEGPQIKGAIELTDWVLMRPDGAGEVDVRGTIRTDDGAVIYMYYTGILDLSKAPASGSPGRCPIRTGVRFETGTERYAFLNRTQGVGIGVADFDAHTVSYDIYALK